jgi:hypothetical protein
VKIIFAVQRYLAPVNLLMAFFGLLKQGTNRGFYHPQEMRVFLPYLINFLEIVLFLIQIGFYKSQFTIINSLQIHHSH